MKSLDEMTDAEYEQFLDEIAGPRAEQGAQKYDARFCERKEGATPSGGAYSIAHYYDENGLPCKEIFCQSC